MRIKTNDPKQPWLQVEATGKVEIFADIRPTRVRFMGPAEEAQGMYTDVVITQREDIPFHITGLRARNGKFFKYSVIKRCSDGDHRCVIRVENTKTEKGRYADLLQVETDSTIRPIITIPVMGYLR